MSTHRDLQGRKLTLYSFVGVSELVHCMLTVSNAWHSFVEESWKTKTRISYNRAVALRLQFFSMRKERAKQCAKESLLTFRTTEVLVKRVVDRFTHFLSTLPSSPDARQEQIDKIRKLGRILWVNTGVLDVSWMEFLRAQCVIDLYDLD